VVNKSELPVIAHRYAPAPLHTLEREKSIRSPETAIAPTAWFAPREIWYPVALSVSVTRSPLPVKVVTQAPCRATGAGDVGLGDVGLGDTGLGDALPPPHAIVTNNKMTTGARRRSRRDIVNRASRLDDRKRNIKAVSRLT